MAPKWIELAVRLPLLAAGPSSTEAALTARDFVPTAMGPVTVAAR